MNRYVKWDIYWTSVGNLHYKEIFHDTVEILQTFNGFNGEFVFHVGIYHNITFHVYGYTLTYYYVFESSFLVSPFSQWRRGC